MFEEKREDIGFSLDVIITQFMWLEKGNMDEKLVKGAINNARKRIQKTLKSHPQLKVKLHEIFLESYEIIKESTVSDKLPEKCKWPLDNLLDKNYYPPSKKLVLVK